MILFNRLKFFLLTGITLLLCIPIFLLLLNLAIDFIQVSKGLVAFGGLFSILILGIGTFAAIVIIIGYYKKGSRKGNLSGRFFLLTSIQMFLFPILHIIYFQINKFKNPQLFDFLIGGGGAMLGILFAVLAYFNWKPS